MKNQHVSSYKPSGTLDQKHRKKKTGQKPCIVVYKGGEEFKADHHWIDGHVVHVYSGAMKSGIARTIPLNAIKHILRGDTE